MMSGGSGTSAGSSMSGGSCMSGSGGMGCSMMQGGMMGGRTAAGAATNRDESVPSLAFRAVNEKMHRDMAVEFTGNVDVDFTKAMIAHHQGAIDMAKIAVAFGKDPPDPQVGRGGHQDPGGGDCHHARLAESPAETHKLRAIGGEEHDGSGVEEGSRGGQCRLRVFPEPPVSADPCEEPLDHPPARVTANPI
jgi:hypothetical protein